MIFLLDTSEDLDTAAAEIGGEVGQLITPLSGFRNRGGHFAIDNGAFAEFNAARFLARLRQNEEHRERCLFVAAPDVVGSARRTLEVFDYWYPRLSAWPIALVAQDGQEDLPIPWELLAAVFIGGSTEWKMSRHARAIVKAAKAMGKWAHVGRVNTPDRLQEVETWGADSVDGTGISQYSWMRRRIANRGSELYASLEAERDSTVGTNETGRDDASRDSDRARANGGERDRQASGDGDTPAAGGAGMAAGHSGGRRVRGDGKDAAKSAASAGPATCTVDSAT